MYEIQSKSDFKTGATLVVRIPEGDLDRKALYTILSDKPEFILPFRYKNIDGLIEFTYQIGNLSKIIYLSGNRSPREYAELWLSMLSPLFDCSDWFMNPYSFVLKTEYIYCDKNGKMISFVYIPSTKDFQEQNALKNVISEIAKRHRSTDINFENKVVWAIQDFSPDEFLQMIKTYDIAGAQKPIQHFVKAIPAQALNEQFESQFAQIPLAAAKPELWPGKPKTAAKIKPGMLAPSKSLNNDHENVDDILTNFPSKGKMLKNKKEKRGWFSSKKELKEYSKKEVNPDTKEINLNVPIIQDSNDIAQLNNLTQLDIHDTHGAKLRYVGNTEHPRVIAVSVAEGGAFTIGRFDVSVGLQQSDFEFDKKTKAISRRHAAIERGVDGYGIVDLASSAGTFISGQKIPPNTPVKLDKGCRVSFGSSGADYVWDE